MATKEKVENPLDMEEINKILSSLDKDFRFCGYRFYEKIEKTFRFRSNDNGYEYFYLIGTDTDVVNPAIDGKMKIGINTKTMEVFSIGRYWKHYINESFEVFIKCMKYVNQKIKPDFSEKNDTEKEDILTEIKEGIIEIDSKTFLDEENWWPDSFIEEVKFWDAIPKPHTADFK